MPGPDDVYREFHLIFKDQLIGIWCSHFQEIQRREYFTICLILIFEMIALTPKPNTKYENKSLLIYKLMSLTKKHAKSLKSIRSRIKDIYIYILRDLFTINKRDLFQEFGLLNSFKLYITYERKESSS